MWEDKLKNDYQTLELVRNLSVLLKHFKDINHANFLVVGDMSIMPADNYLRACLKIRSTSGFHTDSMPIIGYE